MNPNTAKGKRVSVTGIRNLMSEDKFKNMNLDLRMKFPEVLKAGETVGYQLPVAFPVKPNNTLKIGTAPQYYRFHSTARLNKKAGKVNIFFKSWRINQNFDDPTKIVAKFHTGSRWRNLVIRTKVLQGKKYYVVKIFQRNVLNGLVAFFETA